MKDRVEFGGKNFIISTRIDKDNQLESEIEAEEEDSRRTIYLKIEKLKNKPKKEELMKFHNKALSLLFKILQKDDNPTSESFENEENDLRDNLNNDRINLDNNVVKSIEGLNSDEKSRFEKVCRELLDEKQIASFLLKNEELYQYLNDENFASSEDLILKISTTIDFIKDNQDIKRLIGGWKLMIESNDHFNLFASVISDNDLLIVVNNTTIPIGTILKRNEVIKSKIIKELYS